MSVLALRRREMETVFFRADYGANASEMVLDQYMYGNGGGFDRSMQHHLKDLLFKDGVYDPEETVETFSHARD